MSHLPPYVLFLIAVTLNLNEKKPVSSCKANARRPSLGTHDDGMSMQNGSTLGDPNSFCGPKLCAYEKSPLEAGSGDEKTCSS